MTANGSGTRANAILWVITALVGALYIFAGSTKLAGMPPHIEHFAHWGYPDWFRLVVGAVELASGVLLFVPRFARHAACALMVVMTGAVVTHLTHAEAARAPVPLVLLLLLGVVYYLRGRSLADRPAHSAAR